MPASRCDTGTSGRAGGDFNVVPTDEDIYDRVVDEETPCCSRRAAPLCAAARTGMDRQRCARSIRRARLHVLGLLPQSLGARRRPAHRPPAAESGSRAGACATPAWTASCAACRMPATMRPCGSELVDAGAASRAAHCEEGRHQGRAHDLGPSYAVSRRPPRASPGKAPAGDGRDLSHPDKVLWPARGDEAAGHQIGSGTHCRRS